MRNEYVINVADELDSTSKVNFNGFQLSPSLPTQACGRCQEGGRWLGCFQLICNPVPLRSAAPSNFGVRLIFLILAGVLRKSAEWAGEIWIIFFFFYFMFSLFSIQSKWNAILSILHMLKAQSLKAQVKRRRKNPSSLKIIFHRSAKIMIIAEDLPFTVCLDGSPPAYHLSPGFGIGVDNWLVQFEVRNLEICSL